VPPASSHGAHLVARVLREAVNYPAHAPRTATAAYRRAHHQLVVARDLPCLVCGVRQSTLHDPAANPHGATAMETRHHVVEWALTNAIDLAKFNARIVAAHRARRPDDPKYARDFTQAEMEAWIDHDPDNLWVLCDRCHRSPQRGIHALTYPIWTAQDLVRDGYELTSRSVDSTAN